MRPDAASVPDDLSMLNDLSLWNAPSARRALIVWHLTIEDVWHLGKKARVAGAPGHLVVGGRGRRWQILFAHRSEEHTSELQSRGHLVCRLLFEKKNDRRSSSC